MTTEERIESRLRSDAETWRRAPSRDVSARLRDALAEAPAPVRTLPRARVAAAAAAVLFAATLAVLLPGRDPRVEPLSLELPATVERLVTATTVFIESSLDTTLGATFETTLGGEVDAMTTDATRAAGALLTTVSRSLGWLED